MPRSLDPANPSATPSDCRLVLQLVMVVLVVVSSSGLKTIGLGKLVGG